MRARRWYAIGALLIVGAVLMGCTEAGQTATDTYVLTVTATGGPAGGFDIVIRDEEALTDLVAVAGQASPASQSVTGTIDFSAYGTFSVQVTGNGVADGQTITVTVTYTENSFVPPVTRTIDATTLANTAGVAADLDYVLPIALPLD